MWELCDPLQARLDNPARWSLAGTVKVCPDCSNIRHRNAVVCECGHVFPKLSQPEDELSRNVNRRFLGSFLSACAGWLTLGAVVAVFSIFHSDPNSHEQPVVVFGGVLLATSFFVFATWLLIFVPIYLFVPMQSVLWRWPVCTLCGAAAGAAIMCWLGAVGIIGGGVVGGVTCLFASLTRRRFLLETQHNNADGGFATRRMTHS